MFNFKMASIASLNKRAGRTGRVKNGFCFRLITKQFLTQLSFSRNFKNSFRKSNIKT